MTGASNTLNENDVFGNTLLGITVTGNMNLVYKNDVGEDGKGNLGGGILITGDSNLLGKAASNQRVREHRLGIAIVGNNNSLSEMTWATRTRATRATGSTCRQRVDQNNVFANGGDGIEVSGGTAAKPNVIRNNNVGDKGNLGNGIPISTGRGRQCTVAGPLPVLTDRHRMMCTSTSRRCDWRLNRQSDHLRNRKNCPTAWGHPLSSTPWQLTFFCFIPTLAER